ncbi:efflux transporter outer membrane subunit [Xanthomonas campestris pv. phormiicola]|nr:efflux transporter outer membrane subunit [Xanthomonas campestris pv. phormiicola]UYC16740.1 efflux transporter outer membrane subunit [Xanthomonas campestris pv. phormiicola]
MRVRVPRLALASACAVALAGCASTAPRYQRPAAPVPEQFRDAPAGAAAAAAVAALDWRQVFLDQRLQKVIALALDNNRDLRVAVLNIDKARAEYRIQRADLFPSITASGSQTNEGARSGGQSQVSRSASAEVGVSSWELDLFGRIRSLKNEALETYLATEQTQRDTRLSLVAEVAGDWLAVAADQQLLALAKQTLESQRKTLELTERKHEQGVVSGVDLASVQASVERARADLASYSTSVAQARNALELVVGAPLPEQLLPGPAAGADVVALAPLPAALSSTALLQRPDVLYAEHTLKAANADVGAARAAFFPTISLTTSAGRSSDQLSDLFKGAGSRTWSFVPSISIPIFQGGELKAELDQAKISRNIYVADYEKAIQSAFSEVADALAERAHVDEQLDAQRAYVDATRRSYELSDARYRNGVDSYLDALTSQRSYYSAQQDLITLRLTEASNRVALYKVLGGGADAQSDAPMADAGR